MEREVSGSTSYSQTWPRLAHRLQDGLVPSHLEEVVSTVAAEGDVYCVNTVDRCNVLTFAFPRWQATHAALTCARLGLVTEAALDDSWGCDCNASGV
jgi:hypothetical protein